MSKRNRLSLHSLAYGVMAYLLFADPRSAAAQQPASAMSPQTITDTCEGNLIRGFRHYNEEWGDKYGTWVAAPRVDMRVTMERLKASVQKAGFVIGAEDYHGSEGVLSFAMPVTMISDGTQYAGKHFAANFTVDGALGTVAFRAEVADPTIDRIALRSSYLRYPICGMIASALDAPAPLIDDTPQQPKPRRGFRTNRQATADWLAERDAQQNAQQQQMDARTAAYFAAQDQLLANALTNGKALLIMPAINPAIHGFDVQPDDPAYVDFKLDTSSKMIWQTPEGNSTLWVGSQTSLEDIGPRGWSTGLVRDGKLYLLYIVDPGTYSLTGNSFDLRRTSIGQVDSAQWSSHPAIGQASLISTANSEYYHSQQWEDAHYVTREYKDTYCAAVFVEGGGCAYTQTERGLRDEQTSAAGWKDRTTLQISGGVVVSTRLNQPFASFTIGAGEVLLTDGLYAAADNTTINASACKPDSNASMSCNISNYSLTRLAGSAALLPWFAEGVRDPVKAPALTQAMRNAQYRPLTIKAAPARGESGGVSGQKYSLGGAR